MIIGFSNGVFYRLFRDQSDRFDAKYVDIYKSTGANAIELVCQDEDSLDLLLRNDHICSSDFSYISMHAPDLTNDKEAASRILSKLERLHQMIGISNFVFHADRISDWNIFNAYKLPVSIENMDERKYFGRTIDDIGSILEKYPFSLTLDLQHCFVNDPSMKLAIDLQENFSERIVEYHISGYQTEFLHYPLFKTKQVEIIKALKLKNVPVIIESTFNQIEDSQKELAYIKNRLRQYK